MSIFSTSKCALFIALATLLWGFFSCGGPGAVGPTDSIPPATSNTDNKTPSVVEQPSKPAVNTVSTYYGFWPYWIHPASYEPDWRGLTHLSYFSLEAVQGGTLDDQYIGTEYYKIRDTAHAHNVKVTLTITCFDRDIQDEILAYHQRELIDNILKSVQEHGADGVNVDIEDVREINSFTHFSNTSLMQNFMASLYAALKKANPGYHISFCVMGGVEPPYRNPELSKYTDAVFLMGYDYHWSTSPVTGAVSPYGNPDDLSVDESLSTLEKWYPKSQLILGLPFYGYDWPCSSSEPGAKTLGEGAIVYMQDALIRASEYGRQFDAKTKSPWYRYQLKGSWHQCWYDDPESLALKFNYVKSSGIAGVGYWALGYEGNGSPVWESVIKTFKR